MRPVIIMLPLLAIAACATPRESCISDATRDTRVMTALVAETQGNLARGYAIERRQEVRTIRSSCDGRDENGERFSFSCNDTQTINVNVPRAIDLEAEQAKLVSLQARLAQTRIAADRAIAQCIATYPE